jgi:hypothetical protein
MRAGRRSRALRMLGVATLVIVSGVGMSTSGAQTHDDHSNPTTTTTAPGGTTTTTRAPTTTTTAPKPAGTQTKVVNYGPYSIPAAPVGADGKHTHAHTGNQFQFMAEKPCTNCYITGMRANLKYPDGRTAGWSTNAQLHHMVLFNSSWGRQDATCGGQFLGFLGERFFASGDERTPLPSQPGYGYFVSWFDSWTMIYELASEATSVQNVIIEMTYDWMPATTPNMKKLDPVWFDIVQCGLSEFSVPVGPSSQNWTWTVNRPGKVIGLGGHLHDGGVNITVKNLNTGKLLCDSRAGYGETPLYIGHHGESHISSMSTCTQKNGVPVDTISSNQRIQMVSNYNATAAATDAMGIVIMYVSAT